MDEPTHPPQQVDGTQPSRVEVVAYDPAWPELFAELGRQLRGALGEVALRIDHVGSTAVPGLAAKPIVDVQVSVASFEPLDAFKQPLERLGFVYRADNTERTKRYFREPPGTRRTHLHVRRAGSLAVEFRDDRHGYTEAKVPFAWRVIRQADGWAQATGWLPAPSDA